jgi:hypothetical protein
MCKISQGVKTLKIFLSVFGGMYSCRVQNLRRHFKKWNPSNLLAFCISKSLTSFFFDTQQVPSGYLLGITKKI